MTLTKNVAGGLSVYMLSWAGHISLDNRLYYNTFRFLLTFRTEIAVSLYIVNVHVYLKQEKKRKKKGEKKNIRVNIHVQ